MNSDGANIILMSWDMLHGNAALHGWWMSDVSFYTTELPEYVLLDAIRGLSPDVTHIAAALTYTLVLVLAALLAKGGCGGSKQSRATSGEGVARAAITAGIMLAPQLGAGIFILLLSVGHIGTAVPALAVWLLLDLARPRWYVPVIAGVVLAWAMVADSLVLVVAIVPLVIVATARAVRLVAGGTALRAAWYEMSLAGAAAAAIGVSWLGQQAIRAAGGFTLHPVPFSLAAAGQLGRHAVNVGDGLLTLFGANFGQLHSAAAVAFAIVHLAGLALVGWALCRVLRRPFAAGLVDQILVVAIIVNLVVYLFSSFSNGVLNGREIALVLPFGAALAGRSLGPRVRGTRLVPVLLAALAAYTAGLGYQLAQPVSPPANVRLASWLQQHHLSHGLSGYWQASVVTADSGGTVTIRALTTSAGRAGAVPVGGQALLVRPRHAGRQLRRAAGPARLLQLLGARQPGHRDVRAAGPDVPHRPVHRAGLAAEPAAAPCARLGAQPLRRSAAAEEILAGRESRGLLPAWAGKEICVRYRATVMTSDVAQTASGTSRASRRRGTPSTISTASRYTSMNARRSA